MRDDPSDDELDRDVERSAGLGSRLHAPKLVEDPKRVVNLRELRESGDQVLPSEERRLAGLAGEVMRQPQAATESPLRMLVRGPETPRRAAPPPPPPSGEAEAWDRYVAAALPLVVRNGGGEADAAAVADALLAERRKRFG